MTANPNTRKGVFDLIYQTTLIIVLHPGVAQFTFPVIEIDKRIVRSTTSKERL